MPFDKLPTSFTIENTIAALRNNNIEALFVENGEQAKRKVLELLPDGAEVMNMTSVTLIELGLVNEILKSGIFKATRNEWEKMDKKTQEREMAKMGAAPNWVIGSVHAVTEDGHVLIASNTGSQLSAYVYGAKRVIWVVGAQKIVKDVEEGMRRVYEHSLPLESERVKKAYGATGSGVNKLLIFNKEVVQGRVTMIIVNEVLGF